MSKSRLIPNLLCLLVLVSSFIASFILGTFLCLLVGGVVTLPIFCYFILKDLGVSEKVKGRLMLWGLPVWMILFVLVVQYTIFR